MASTVARCIVSWARGKRRGFSPGAAAHHRSRTRVPRTLSFAGLFYLSLSLFPPSFFSVFEIALHCPQLCPISDFSKKNARETSDCEISQKNRQITCWTIRRDSGPTPVARGGSGAKAAEPPLAARPGSRIRPRYSNWETSWIGYERGSEVGKGEYTWKGGMVGTS